MYIEPFFGAGGMFFQKSKAKYNIVNDIDSDVFNLFQVVMNQKEELEKAFHIMPIHADLLEYWKKNKEVEPVRKALRFLLMSNFGYMGKPDSILFSMTNAKELLLKNIKNTVDLLAGVQFNNSDFRKFLKSWQLRHESDKDFVFIYNDPPYQKTSDNYSNSFVKQDLIDLIEVNISTGCKFAISEFDNPIVLKLAKHYKLNEIIICERQTLKNRRTEILITNYQKQQMELF
jgi:DNA adenine methylase